MTLEKICSPFVLTIVSFLIAAAIGIVFLNNPTPAPDLNKTEFIAPQDSNDSNKTIAKPEHCFEAFLQEKNILHINIDENGLRKQISIQEALDRNLLKDYDELSFDVNGTGELGKGIYCQGVIYHNIRNLYKPCLEMDFDHKIECLKLQSKDVTNYYLKWKEDQARATANLDLNCHYPIECYCWQENGYQNYLKDSNGSTCEYLVLCPRCDNPDFFKP
jgi:hypothetical protein